MVGNRDLKFLKINRSDFQSFFHKFYSRFINGEGQVTVSLHMLQVHHQATQLYLKGGGQLVTPHFQHIAFGVRRMEVFISLAVYIKDIDVVVIHQYYG